jgi:hypothetical protein
MEALALTVVTLLASRAAETFGAEAGTGAWSLLKRLGEAVKRKFSGDPPAEEALDEVEAGQADEAKVQAVADAVAERARQDPAFLAELEALVAEARQDPDLGRFVTVISGNASVGKVTNIGEVHGDVSF